MKMWFSRSSEKFFFLFPNHIRTLVPGCISYQFKILVISQKRRVNFHSWTKILVVSMVTLVDVAFSNWSLMTTEWSIGCSQDNRVAARLTFFSRRMSFNPCLLFSLSLMMFLKINDLSFVFGDSLRQAVGDGLLRVLIKSIHLKYDWYIEWIWARR